jgi:hypothetical protein
MTYFCCHRFNCLSDPRDRAAGGLARSRLARCRSARMVSPFLLPRRGGSPKATSRFFSMRCQNLLVPEVGGTAYKLQKQCVPRE